MPKFYIFFVYLINSIDGADESSFWLYMRVIGATSKTLNCGCHIRVPNAEIPLLPRGCSRFRAIHEFWHFLLLYGAFRMELCMSPCLRILVTSLKLHSDQKMARRAVYVVICQSFFQSSYEVKRSQRHLLAAIEKNRLGGPISTLPNLFYNGQLQKKIS